MKKSTLMFYMLLFALLIFLGITVISSRIERGNIYEYQYSAPVIVDSIISKDDMLIINALMETGSEYSVTMSNENYKWIKEYIGYEINGVFGVDKDGTIHLISFVEE